MGLEIVGLKKSFQNRKTAETVHVLDDIDYHAHDSRFVSIVGPSGCGKTTLLRIIAGLEKPSEGNLLLDGHTVTVASGSESQVLFDFERDQITGITRAPSI